MDDLAAAEHHAQKGEIVLDAVGDRRPGRPRRAGASCGATGRRRDYGVFRGLLVDVEAKPGPQPPALPEELVRPWLLPAVYERLRTGRGEFLAELRPAIPVFLRFGGIDYDNDDDAIEKLDEFVRAAQGVFNGFGGNVLQLTLGDKGAYLYGVFGSPLAHEDDSSRAVAAALDLRDLEKTTAARDIQIGIAHGRLRSGTYGHEMRRTFVCLGDAVNLAARLMGAAPVARIYVAGDVREDAGEALHLGATAGPHGQGQGRSGRGRGRSTARSSGRPAARRGSSSASSARRRSWRSSRPATRRPRRATAGSSASRPRPAWASRASWRSSCATSVAAATIVAFGECQAYGTRTPYFVWREIWRTPVRPQRGRPARRARSPP